MSSTNMAYAAVHENPSGPGDARPTALNIVEDQNQIGNLEGKTILITGGTSGLGLETAKALLTTRARIFITARQAQKGEEIARSLASGTGSVVEVLEMKLDSFVSIKAAVTEFLKRSPTLNVLICNAGVMSCPESRTQDGFETQFGVNYLGHFLLFQLLKEALKTSSSTNMASRVVTLSSSAHRSGSVRLGDYNFDKEPYDEGQAYGQAKTADIYLANEIERQYGKQGIHGLSVHPGFIKTPLLRHLVNNKGAQQFISEPKGAGLWKSPEQGAATIVWAAIGRELEGRGGRYLEDVRESLPFDKDKAWHPGYAAGYAKYAYDAKASGQLWRDSLAMIGPIPVE